MMHRMALAWGVSLALVLASQSNSLAQSDARLLLVGNSYTFGNDLDQLVKQIAEAGVPSWQQVHAVRQAPGGYRWEQHAQDADGTRGDTPLRQLLVTDASPQNKWDFVILQEQSQIPGFPQNGSYWRASLAGLKVLHGLIQAKGATTVLLMTWGRRTGDATNQARYPDYKTMQRHLADGYRAYAAQASTTSSKILIAPVGLAFEKIYDDIKAAGQDPLASTSAFSTLYTSDNSHPSLRGSFLAACVIYATITGRDPRQVSWGPAGIPAAERQLYQAAAWAVTKPAGTSEVPNETTKGEASPEPPQEGAVDAKPSDSPDATGEPTPDATREPSADGQEPASQPDAAAEPQPELPAEAGPVDPVTSEAKLPDGHDGPDASDASGGGDAAGGQGCCQVGADLPMAGLVLFVLLWLGCVQPRRREVSPQPPPEGGLRRSGTKAG